MIYPERESKHLEFKLELPSFNALIKTCVAFANGIGGEIIIGIEDDTRKLIGVNDSTKERVYEDFPNALYDSTEPSLVPQIYEKLINEVSVIVIKVAPTNRKPCFIKSKGIPEGVYCRVGPHTRKGTQDYVEELMRYARHNYFDSEAVLSDEAILDEELLKDFYMTSTVAKKRLLNDKILTYVAGNNEELTPTIAACLFFSKDPSQYLVEAQILCTKFSGIEGRNIIQTETITGNILEQAEVSINLVKKWLSTNYKLRGARLSAKTIIPEVAIREAINNALLHRKYNIPGAIKISIYDNRLEIFSPGQFPGLVDVNHLGDGTTYLRNPTIVRIARHFGLIERLGSGIQLIYSSCKKAGIKKPKYFETGDFVKVVFMFEPEISSTKTHEDTILQLFDFKTEVLISDVMNHLNVSRNTATRYLNALIANGKIHRVGKGPSVRYLKEQ